MNECAVTAIFKKRETASGRRRATRRRLLSTSVGGDVTTLVGIATNVSAADLVRRLLTGEMLGVGVGFLVVLGGEDVLADLFLGESNAEELILA